jgi:hypothetical protein
MFYKNKQLDLNKFSKDFFKNSSTTADVSVDANANVVSHTGVELMYSTKIKENRDIFFR